MPTVHGSPEHLAQVVRAHVVTYYGSHAYCRCGARVGPTETDRRAHLADVWKPYPLPDALPVV